MGLHTSWHRARTRCCCTDASSGKGAGAKKLNPSPPNHTGDRLRENPAEKSP